MDSEHFDAELAAITAEYRRQKMIEHMIGPVVAAVFHVALFFGLTIFVVWDTEKEEQKDIVVEQIEQEQVEIEPDKEPEPEPEEEIKEDEFTESELTVDTDSEVEDVNFDEEDSEDSPLPSLDIKDLKSPLKSPYEQRSKKGVGANAVKFGGGENTIQAVDKALRWLKKKQNPDGSWGNLGQLAKAGKGSSKLGSRPALTGLALLTFLAQGESQHSQKYGKNIRKALQWLSDEMIKHRYFGGANHHGYEHYIATYALAEAAGITDVMIVRDAMEVGVDTIIKKQQKSGGFNYNGEDKLDMSYSAWAFQALKAATVAGCTHPDLERSKDRLIKAMEDNYMTINHKKIGKTLSGYTYTKGYASTLTSNSSFALLCMQLHGKSGEAHAKKSYDSLKDYIFDSLQWEPELWASGGRPFKMGMPLYTWYYTTQVFFNKQGADWRKWNAKFKPLYLKSQKPEGYWESPSSGEFKHKALDSSGDLLNGQIYSTAFCAITLTVYYRNLPTLKKVSVTKKKVETVSDEEVEDLEIF